MAFTYSLSTDAGKVRLLIMDTNASSYVFEDNEIDAFLAMESVAKRAAALALETIASNEAFTLKVIQLLDLKTDGAKTSDALLKRAKSLREQADYDEESTDSGFEIAEFVTDTFTARDRVWNEALVSG